MSWRIVLLLSCLCLSVQSAASEAKSSDQLRSFRQGPYFGLSWMQSQEAEATNSETGLSSDTQFGYQIQHSTMQFLLRYAQRNSAGGNESLNLDVQTRFIELRLAKKFWKAKTQLNFLGSLGLGMSQTRVTTDLLGQSVTQSSDWLGFLRPAVVGQFSWQKVQIEVEGFLFSSENLQPNPAFGFGLGASFLF